LEGWHIVLQFTYKMAFPHAGCYLDQVPTNVYLVGLITYPTCYFKVTDWLSFFLLTYLSTYSMVQDILWRANSHSAC